jgi:hypothetical protein
MILFSSLRITHAYNKLDITIEKTRFIANDLLVLNERRFETANKTKVGEYFCLTPNKLILKVFIAVSAYETKTDAYYVDKNLFLNTYGDNPDKRKAMKLAID